MAVLELRDDTAVAAVVLAAGTGSRMGRTKQLLPYEGAPLLQAAIDAAVASDVLEVVVVLGYRADEIRKAVEMPTGKPLRFVVCLDYAEGQSASLACGLRSVSDNVSAAAVLLGDQPDVDSQFISRVVAAWRESFEPITRPVFISEDGERVPGHPVVLERSVWGVLAEQTGDDGPRKWLRAHPEFLSEVEITRTAPGDVDTWEDYLRIANRNERLDGAGSKRNTIRKTARRK